MLTLFIVLCSYIHHCTKSKSEYISTELALCSIKIDYL